jgi:hypothetical protein
MIGTRGKRGPLGPSLGVGPKGGKDPHGGKRGPRNGAGGTWDERGPIIRKKPLKGF